MVPLQVSVVESAVPRVVPVEAEGGDRGEIAKVDDRNRLVISDETNADDGVPVRIRWWGDCKEAWSAVEWIVDLGEQHPLVGGSFRHPLAGCRVDSAGIGRFAIDPQPRFGEP